MVAAIKSKKVANAAVAKVPVSKVKKSKGKAKKEAQRLLKQQAKKAISDKLNRPPIIKKQRGKHQFDPLRLNRGVVMIQNLPHGFFEEQLLAYFSQYGRVTRLRLARSERTGNSRGYAFLEFRYPEVAEVAAEAMNNYLMFRHVLKTVYIPPNEQKWDYFKQTVRFIKRKNGTLKLHTPYTVRLAKQMIEYNKNVSRKVQAERNERSKYKIKKAQEKYSNFGNIDLSSGFYVKPKPENSASTDDDDKIKVEKGVHVTQEKTDKKKNKRNEVKIEKLSDDEDYKPSADDLAEVDAFVEGLLREEQSDEDDDGDDNSGDEENDGKENTLTQLVNDTIATSDEEDDDYVPTETEIANAKSFAQEAAKQLAKKKPPVEFNSDDDDDDLYSDSTESFNANDTLVDFVNNTINSDEDSDDDDFDISEEEIVSPPKKATKQQKSIEKKPKSAVIPTATVSIKKQKKTTADTAKSQADSSQTKRNGKQIKSKSVKPTQSTSPNTSPKSKRANFVTAPTPSPAVPKGKKTQHQAKEKQSLKSSPNKKENSQSAAPKKAVKTPATTSKLTALKKASGGIQKKKESVNKKSILANKGGKVNAEKLSKVKEAAAALLVTQNNGKVAKPKPQLKGKPKKTK